MLAWWACGPGGTRSGASIARQDFLILAPGDPADLTMGAKMEIKLASAPWNVVDRVFDSWMVDFAPADHRVLTVDQSRNRGEPSHNVCTCHAGGFIET